MFISLKYALYNMPICYYLQTILSFRFMFSYVFSFYLLTFSVSEYLYTIVPDLQLSYAMSLYGITLTHPLMSLYFFQIYRDIILHQEGNVILYTCNFAHHSISNIIFIYIQELLKLYPRLNIIIYICIVRLDTYIITYNYHYIIFDIHIQLDFICI